MINQQTSTQKVTNQATSQLVTWYGTLSTSFISMLKLIYVVSPFILYFILTIFNVNSVLFFIFMTMFLAFLGLIFAGYTLVEILKKDTGTSDMKKIAKYITDGSEGYFITQYGTIFKLSFVFCFIIMIVYYTRPSGTQSIIQSEDSIEQNNKISNLAMGLFSGLSFMLGAMCSAFSGFSGMWVSVRANIRVAAACRKCYNDSIVIAFKGGFFAAVINIALAIFGITLLFLVMYIYLLQVLGSEDQVLQNIDELPLLLIGFGFGASFVAMFAQLGGGIFTKAADVGADLIGKIEAGIPEDDPRNPAVIADLVGDNVGDCAGQAADLFESISAEIISAMILGATLSHEANFSTELKVSFMFFPLALHCVDMIVSTIGMFFVRTKPGLPQYDQGYGNFEDSLDIMKKGYRVSMFLGVISFVLLCYFFLNPAKYPNAWVCFTLCGMIGIIVSYLFIEVTQYYTDYNYSPVRSIVNSSKTGHATNIISGLSVGLESTGLPIIIISVAVISSYYLGELSGIQNQKGECIGGLFGTAIATMGMFCTGIFILSMSGFGPIADNAGGIVEMSGQPPEVRDITDKLDAVGNVTKANTKGYSVGSASLACFLLFSAFLDEINFISPDKLKTVDITIPEVFIGGLLGSMTVFVFTSWSLASVGNAAQDVIMEVRRQFTNDPGILEGTSLPDYKTCVQIVAKAGLREMVKPGLLAVLSPIIVGFTFRIIGGYRGDKLLGAQVIAAYLMFSTATGILMALFMNNAGGAWDNSKKYVESGACGGKGSQTHHATITGDTVGDPFKDTAGPALHILIKLLSTITLVLAPLFIANIDEST